MNDLNALGVRPKNSREYYSQPRLYNPFSSMYPMLTMTNSNKRKLIAGPEMIGEANLSPEVTPPWRNYMGECCRGS